MGYDFYKIFKPELTPKKMLELGVFGGSYFVGTSINEFPKAWFKKAKLSKTFDVSMNRFKIAAGLSRKEWVDKGWIFKEDPLGWFQWYCRYTIGRRIENIDEIQIQKNDDHTNQVKLDNSLMMELRYPSLDQFIKSNFDFDDKNQMDQSFALIASCIDKIYSEDEVWATADCTKKEMNDFLESMNSSQFKEIEKFFETMPKLKHEIKITNPKTGVESDVVLEGLASFFA